MKKIGVILLSGGLDSTTVAALAVNQGYELTGITAHYGQKHSKEIESARKVAGILGIKHKVIDVSFYREMAWYSALTSPGEFAIPKNQSDRELSVDIPITYVPLRNTFFITIASAFIESEALYLIEQKKLNPQDLNVSVFIAANAVDYSGYPDCRPEYYKRMSGVIFHGSKLGVQYNKSIDIETPIIMKSKAEIIKTAMELEAPLEYSWSCYEGGELPCGRCDSCLIRAKGFTESGYEDPLLLRLNRERSENQGK